MRLLVTEYVLIFAFLFLFEAVYLRLAAKFALFDVPNIRSSHDLPVIRGGGIVIVVAVLVYYLQADSLDGPFVAGLLIVTGLGFWDDLNQSPTWLRMAGYLTAVLLGLHETGIVQEYDLWVWITAAIVATGAINATNFMDGVNGITAIYGLVMVSTLIWINIGTTFIDQDMLVYCLLGLLVFGYHNIRTNANCFAGDVGSAGLAFILIYFTSLLVLVTKDPSYVLLWTVYGVDSVLTIVQRILKRENIFRAHRLHLYQYLANEKRWGHLPVSFLYGGIQFSINMFTVFLVPRTAVSPFLAVSMVLIASGALYILVKYRIIKSLERSNP